MQYERMVGTPEEIAYILGLGTPTAKPQVAHIPATTKPATTTTKQDSPKPTTPTLDDPIHAYAAKHGIKGGKGLRDRVRTHLEKNGHDLTGVGTRAYLEGKTSTPAKAAPIPTATKHERTAKQQEHDAALKLAWDTLRNQRGYNRMKPETKRTRVMELYREIIAA